MIGNLLKQLPLGSVRAQGYLLRQMEMQRDNFTGMMEQYPDYGANSAWLGGNGESWERGPYYVRGLVALAYCLNDEELIRKSRKWIDAALESQTPDGNFGPAFPKGGPELEPRRQAARAEWWAKMPMLFALRDYWEAERALGREDERVLPFFQRYFRYQYRSLEGNPLTEWAKARGADNVELVLWYADVSGERGWTEELADLLMKQTFDWSHSYRHDAVRHHVVNTTQGFKYPFMAYRLHKETNPLETLEKGLAHIRRDHGRIDDLPNADEAARDNLFTRGTETCAVAEAMLSMEIAGCVTGDSTLYDHLETYAYNSLPNCFDYEVSRHCYFQLQNQVMATVGTHGFDCDHGDSCTYGGPTGYDCCFANSHMAYPKFVQNMWQQTGDGLALVCYGPNTVECSWKGHRLAFEQKTRYPYGDMVLLKYTGEAAEFTLSLRIPDWVQDASLRVNGQPVVLCSQEGYHHMTRRFITGDEVEIDWNSAVRIIPWYDGAAAVRKGALLYCLPVPEQVEELSDESPYREIEFAAKPEKKTLEYFPAGPWNYALDVRRFICRENPGEITLRPESPPCYLKAWGIRDENWQLEGNKAAHLPIKKKVMDEGLLEELTLIPYSCTRLKISLFPKVYHCKTTGAATLELSARPLCGCVQVDFATAPEADEYILLVCDDSPTAYRVPVNPYKGGARNFQKRDRFAFSYEGDTGGLSIQLVAFKENTKIAHSELVLL